MHEQKLAVLIREMRARRGRQRDATPLSPHGTRRRDQRSMQAGRCGSDRSGAQEHAVFLVGQLDGAVGCIGITTNQQRICDMAAGQVQTADVVTVGIECFDNVARPEGNSDDSGVIEPCQGIERGVEREAVNGAA